MPNFTVNLAGALIHKDANLLDTLLKLARRDFNIDNPIKNEIPALHFAVLFRRVDIAKVLLAHGANVNLWDKDGYTGLHLAPWNKITPKNVSRARKILEDVELDEALKKELVSPLSPEAKDHQPRAYQKLFESDDDEPVHKTHDRLGGLFEGIVVCRYEPSLEYDSVADDYSLIELLLRSGANPNLRCIDGSGNTPLLRNCGNCCERDTSILELMFEYGTDVHIKSDEGETTLGSAVENCSIEQVEKLFDLGAASVCDVSTMQNLLARVISNSVNIGDDDEDDDAILIAKQLIERGGARVNALDRDGMTPLQVAVQSYSSLTLIEYLFSLGADPNLNSNEREAKPALALAFDFIRDDVAEYLIDHGADVFYKNPQDQSSLLKNAVSLTCKLFSVVDDALSCVTLLMERGVTINKHNLADLNEEKVDLIVKCQVELNFMKIIRICPDPQTTYFDFLVKRDRALVRCLRNENISAAIESRAYKNQFRCFSKRLDANYERGLKQMKMLDELRSILSDVFGLIFPEELIVMICDYFDLEDLNKCFENTKFEQSQS